MKKNPSTQKTLDNYKLLVDAGYEGIVIVEKGIIIHANNQFAEMFGYDYNGVIGTNPTEFVSDKFKEMVEHHIKEQYDKSYEITALRKDGSTFPCEVWGRKMLYQGTEVRVTTLRDLTDQKLAHNALVESERKFRSITEQSLMGVTILQYGVLKYVNQAAADIFGYKNEELLKLSRKQLNDGKLIHSKDHEFVKNQRKQLQKSKNDDTVKDFAYRIITKSGKEKWIYNRSKIAPYNGKKAILGTIIDITDRIQVEIKLKESEERYTTLFDSAPIGIVAIRQSIIVFANQQFIKMYACTSKSDVIGSRIQKFQPAELREKLQQRGYRREMGKNEPTSYESIGLKKNGKKFPINIDVTQIHLPDGPAILGFIQDLTEIKKAEKEKQKLQEKIQQSKKFESLGVLAGGIAHDFNNILMEILNCANLSSIGLPTDSPVQPLLKQIEESSGRAAHLARQMLALSGKGKFIVKTRDLIEIIQEVKKEIVIPKSIQIKYNYENTPLLIDCDKPQIKEMLMSLITNSKEAISEKKGIILLSTGIIQVDKKQPEYILGENLIPGDYIYFEIKDNGKGIEKEEIKKIFDPFYSSKFVGRGLGLSVVFAIVRGHNGAIKVDSRIGIGTSITILIPASKEIIKSEDKGLKIIKRGKGKKTILICDDEKVIRNVLKTILNKNNFNVLLAYDGINGIDVYKNNINKIDIVLMDLSMPNMNGEIALQKIKEINPNIPVILMSGYSEQESINELTAGNIDDFIQKPFNNDILLKSIDKVLYST